MLDFSDAADKLDATLWADMFDAAETFEAADMLDATLLEDMLDATLLADVGHLTGYGDFRRIRMLRRD